MRNDSLTCTHPANKINEHGAVAVTTRIIDPAMRPPSASLTVHYNASQLIAHPVGLRPCRKTCGRARPCRSWIVTLP
jgi:hypothetical protein